MLFNPADRDRNDITIRFRRAPQGLVARFFDWIGVLSLAISVLSLLVFWISGSLETEGLSLRICLTCLNISIICFVAARLLELADRLFQMSNRDHQ